MKVRFPDVKIGRYCLIEDDVVIGEGTTIGDYVKLKAGTRIGRNCNLDDYVNTSGHCIIEDRVIVKRCTMIGQATWIEPDAWIGSCVATTRLKYPVLSEGEEPEEKWVHVCNNAIIGSKALLLTGVTVGAHAFVAAGAVVVKDCRSYGIYIGVPAKFYRMRLRCT